MKRVLLAALVGGLIAFAWSALARTVLPLGQAGIAQLPQEEAVLAPMKETIHQSGLYYFPGMDMKSKPSKEEEQAWQAKLRSGPYGLLIYHPNGTTPMSPKQLVNEFLTTAIAALIAALVLVQIGPGRTRRALTVMLLGLFSWFAISTSYWNWYGYPGSFILAEGADQVIGWFLAGLAMAGIVRSSSRERRFT